MNVDEFKATLQEDAPPVDQTDLLVALWYDAKGDWDRAHRIAQEIKNADGSWVHAYLHRKEGDEGNAGYWYNRAGKPFCSESLEVEWESLVARFVG